MSLRDLRRKIRSRRRDAAGDARSAIEDTDLIDLVEDAAKWPSETPLPTPPQLNEAEHAALAAAQACAPAFAAQLQALDPWQLRAVLAEPSAAIVEAQVGSGKTTVLVHKVAFLHLVRGVPLSQMAVLTFTNKAAAEFRDRVRALLASVHAPDGTLGEAMRWFGTFHALARALLVHDLPLAELGFQRNFHVMDAAERMALWQRLIASHDLNIKHRRRLDRRMELLQQGQIRFGNMRKDDDLLQLAELAAAEKRARGVMDFDDLLANAHALLAAHGVLRPPAWLIVDELQDCDLDQLDLIDRLAGPATRRFYVGDPNQVIYSWRGSAPKLFDHLRAHHGAETFALPMNYRSTATIVHAARAFLQGSGRLDPASVRTSELVPARGQGAPLDIVTCHDPRAEATWLAEQIADLLANGAKPTAVAVLARTRRGLAPIRAALLAAGLPVTERGGWQVDELPTAQWLLHLLRTGLGDGDFESAVLALTHREHGLVAQRDVARTADTIATAHAQSHALAGLATQLREPERGRRRKDIDRELAATVVDRLRTLNRLVDAGADTAQVMAHLLIAAQLGPTRPDHDKALAICEAWMGALLMPISATDAGVGTAISGAAGLLAARVSAASVDSGPLHQAAAAQSNADAGGLREGGVQLLTMHAAKGLEWDTVFLAGLNAGAVPLPTAMRDPAQLSEERRLFFVALTRARDRLVLSWVRSPDDPRQQPIESAFVRLLPSELAVRHDYPAPLFGGESGLLEDDGGVTPASDTPGAADPASRPEVSTTTPDQWRTGQAVRHKRYGIGTIVTVTETGVQCDFGRRGVKTFTRAMCPITALEDPP